MTLSNQGKSHFFILQNDSLLLLKDNRLPTDLELTSMKSHFLRSFKLGQLNNIEYHCAEIGKDVLIPDVFHIFPLRKALALFGDNRYGMAVKAYSIITWDKNHQFCSRCGHVTVHQTKIFERLCTACGLNFFPRISPSVIVLIKRGDYLLMARSPHFLPGVYGLIAGFVDPGESAEEAVHREVMEEVGLQIKDLSYFGSQPWPFPDSLMMAFTANYASGEIIIDKNEIEEADWYKYDSLPGRPSTAISIASKLINEFVNCFNAK